ncbi:hypothetical protein MOQ_004496 [Trypanosoma cruzi marinkellei]|uniref:Uncharacterized protein n=1 Tax=Trypanosoma cruzi marinkellei TaxID=85056 RepID=K2N9X3_TRYCR|nr:hypothetical protein MOQ_004496 [Trypanosoma cruzi marinkellei]
MRCILQEYEWRRKEKKKEREARSLWIFIYFPLQTYVFVILYRSEKKNNPECCTHAHTHTCIVLLLFHFCTHLLKGGKMIDRETQTPESQLGAQLRIHFKGLSRRMGLVVVAVALLCILNGCSYYLYWRPLFAYNPSPPVALYATLAGVFFLFIMAQGIIQIALHTMIEHINSSKREREIRRCYFFFFLALLPATSGQLSLYAGGWIKASEPKAVICIFTVSLDLFCILCSLAHVWVSICVHWIHMGVFRAALEKRAKRRNNWDKQLAYIISTVKPPDSSLYLDPHRPSVET